MATVLSDNPDSLDQPVYSPPSASSVPSSCDFTPERDSCCHCRQVMEQLSCRHTPSEPVPIGQLLLVFFLPLVSAAAVVILAVRSLPFLAEHPGYLVLAALAAAAGALVLAKLLTRRSHRRAKGNS